MEYSTKQGKLIMPEYGRNVQHMVEHALTLEDKEERNKCVQAIMQTMGNLFPYLRNEESRHKMYDHLAIMSDFRLDIDSPFERPDQEDLRYKPERLDYNTARPIRFRHYGRMIEAMVQQAIAEEDIEKRKDLVRIIVSRMRQNYILWNKEQVNAERIREDLHILSKGLLTEYFEDFDTPLVLPTANYQPNKKRKWR